MSIKLTEELLHLNTFVGQNPGQVAVEGTLTLPSHKPACAEVVHVIAVPKTHAVQIEEDSVVAEGSVQLTAIYLAVDDEGEISYESVSWDRVLPFSYVFDVPGAVPGMEAEVSFELGELNVEASADGRSLLAECVIDGIARVTQAQEVWVVVDALSTASKKLAVESETVRIEEVLSSVTDEFVVSGTVALPAGAPFIEELFYAGGNVVVTSARYQYDKLIVDGVLALEILYRPEGEQTVLARNWPDAIRFEQVVDVEGAVPGLHPQVVLSVKELTAQPVIGGSGLDLNGVIEIKAKAVEPRSIPVVLDIAGDKNGVEIACRKEEIRLEKRVNNGVRTVQSKFTIEMPESKPPIDRITAFRTKARITDYKLQPNRVAVTGVIDAEMLYEGHVDLTDPPVYAARWASAATFDAVVDVPGAEPDMDVQVEVGIVNQFPDLINRETCEVTVDIRVAAKVTEVIDLEAVAEAVEVKQTSGRAPSYVCVRVQPDDTLWKIATRYGSTVEMLVDYNPELNDLDNLDELPVGMRLFIPRQRKPAMNEA